MSNSSIDRSLSVTNKIIKTEWLFQFFISVLLCFFNFGGVFWEIGQDCTIMHYNGVRGPGNLRSQRFFIDGGISRRLDDKIQPPVCLYITKILVRYESDEYGPFTNSLLLAGLHLGQLKPSQIMFLIKKRIYQHGWIATRFIYIIKDLLKVVLNHNVFEVCFLKAQFP